MYKFRRRAGLLLHPSSLPSPYGIGDLGTTAYQWVDLCSRYDQTIWQIFPLGPVGYGYSPYDSLSSFAGNPLLISPEKLIEEGLLSQADVVDYLPLSLETIDYSKVVYEKETLYR
ncbi:MAG: 4-alpha-glucanotransferase, partial [Chitinivibrionales bacterium]|nr:4-alpha-glucanotransferase [Chitinivibrionales bacterium]